MFTHTTVKMSTLYFISANISLQAVPISCCSIIYSEGKCNIQGLVDSKWNNMSVDNIDVGQENKQNILVKYILFIKRIFWKYLHFFLEKIKQDTLTVQIEKHCNAKRPKPSR